MPRIASPQLLRVRAEATPDIEYPDIANTPTTDDAGGEPYAQLIYRALKSAPNHSMITKDIYKWFEQNTDKANTVPISSAKGWQNSIRHNLSMNDAFIKVEQIPSKEGFIWVLAESALLEGVKPTKRYRKQKSKKKSSKTESPVIQRQLSGARGGKAAKESRANATRMASSKLQRATQRERATLTFQHDNKAAASQSPSMEDYDVLQYQVQYHTSPYYYHTSTSTPLPMTSIPRTSDYGDIVGCWNNEGPLFHDEPLDRQYWDDPVEPFLWQSRE